MVSFHSRWKGRSKFWQLLAVRASSVFIVQTYFVPDEYWQSLEIAHRLSFGFGYVTWEWFKGIRSLFYPLLISVVYKHLENCGLDDPYLLVYTPRVCQVLLTMWTEWKFVTALGKKFSGRQQNWLLYLQSGSYFVFYVGSRNLGNTLEMNLVMLGVAYFVEGHKGSFIACVFLSTYLRPTCAPLWLPFALLFTWSESKWLISTPGMKIFSRCVTMLIILIALDSWWYGQLTLVPIEFLQFNFVNNFSEFYGSHPWHWYASNALPSLFGPTLLPATMSIFATDTKVEERRISRLLQLATVLYTLFHSLVGHKEIRFLTPIIPLVHVSAVFQLAKWSPKWQRVFVILLLLWNVPIACYLGMRHQRGVMDVMDFLRSQITSRDSVFFLMPCHSTPFYSHLHVNATLKFLTCPPDFNDELEYIDEADRFFEDPDDWLLEHVSSVPPTYLVLFDVLLNGIASFLDGHNYHLISNMFHADVEQGRIGKRILVFKIKNVK